MTSPLTTSAIRIPIALKHLFSDFNTAYAATIEGVAGKGKEAIATAATQRLIEAVATAIYSAIDESGNRLVYSAEELKSMRDRIQQAEDARMAAEGLAAAAQLEQERMQKAALEAERLEAEKLAAAVIAEQCRCEIEFKLEKERLLAEQAEKEAKAAIALAEAVELEKQSAERLCREAEQAKRDAIIEREFAEEQMAKKLADLESRLTALEAENEELRASPPSPCNDEAAKYECLLEVSERKVDEWIARLEARPINDENSFDIIFLTKQNDDMRKEMTALKQLLDAATCGDISLDLIDKAEAMAKMHASNSPSEDLAAAIERAEFAEGERNMAVEEMEELRKEANGAKMLLDAVLHGGVNEDLVVNAEEIATLKAALEKQTEELNMLRSNIAAAAMAKKAARNSGRRK